MRLLLCNSCSLGCTWNNLWDLAALVLKGKSHGALELHFSTLELDSIDRLLHSQGGAHGDQEEGEAKKPHLLQDRDVDSDALILSGGPLLGD